MEKTPANLRKEYVESQQKELFAQVLQQVMECELDAQLGYEKNERVSNPAVASAEKNYCNGSSKKTVKTQLGKAELKIPRPQR